MNATMIPYVVRQGDYLVKLAFHHGFDVDEVWKHPKNAEIRGKRGDHHVLAPGDVVYLPVKPKEGLPLRKGTTNRYVAKVPRVPINLSFHDERGPLAGTPFIAKGGAKPAEGKTDGEGKVTLHVPVHVTEVTVELPEHGLRQRVLVGHLDPIGESTGAVSRLLQLGYLRRNGDGSVPTAEDAVVREAIVAFQNKQGIDPTGALDQPTRDALQQAYGA